MVRVLQVVTYMGRGGLETMLMNYYRHIDRSRVQFDFLVHRPFEADYDAEIRDMGGKIYRVSRLIPWSRAYRAELRNFFHAHPDYRIVHVHQDCLSAVALQCARDCGVPVRIAHSHSSSQTWNIKYPIKRYYMKQIPAAATHLFACGRQAGDWMFGGSPYRVIPNAIEAPNYRYDPQLSRQVRQELGLGDGLVVGHVGNANPAKNHPFLLEIFAALHQKRPDARLILVGGGTERFRAKARSLGVEDAVLFAGVRKDVPRMLQAMDVFVFPSLYEGLPVALLEAQAAGLPCVISDQVPTECVVTGSLVTTLPLHRMPAQWADTILEKTGIPRVDHSAELRAAGYDIGTTAKALEEFYWQKGGGA